MKKLQNNYTTPEQSKRLLELGVPADSADCYLTRFGIDEDWEVKILNNVKYSEITINNQEYCNPCWSVGRLMEIYETCTSTKFERWSHRGVFRPLLEDCIEHINFALNPNTIMGIDFSKLEK